MIRSYVVRPAMPIDDMFDGMTAAVVGPIALVIHEAEAVTTNTGLIDKRGNPIGRVDSMAPIGFDLSVRGKS